MTHDGGGIGGLLREWRNTRGKSQLALALEARVSARHVSFIETGRSKPSRDMVLHLAAVLDVPLRERNALLAAAGYAAMYRATDLDAEEMQPVRDALDRILRQQEPHPAVVMDRHWNITRVNEGARMLFGRLIDLSAVPEPPNVLRMMFDPAWLRPWVENWEEVARSLMIRVQREAICGAPDAQLNALIAELRAQPGVPTGYLLGHGRRPVLPIVPVVFRRGDFRCSYFSTVTTLGTPLDIGLQEIRIECFFPVAPL